MRCTLANSSFKPALQWDNHFSSLLYESAPRDDSDMFIFLEFRLGCLSSAYQKYPGVCSSCSVYTFFSEVFIANSPCVYVKIHTIILEAGGIQSALNAVDPFWSRSCLRIKTRYRSLLTSATFCQHDQCSGTITTSDQHYYHPLELSIQMPCKRHTRRLNRTWRAEL